MHCKIIRAFAFGRVAIVQISHRGVHGDLRGARVPGEAAEVDEIYILGDLVEMWIGDDDDSPLAQALTQSLNNATARCSVFLMHGNRDFLFKDRFAERTGVCLIEDMHQPDPNLLLCHGDLLCTDDTEYQALRKQLRGVQWQQEFLAQSLAERRAFGEDLRRRSKQENANKAESIMDANTEAITDAQTSTNTLLKDVGCKE